MGLDDSLQKIRKFNVDVGPFLEAFDLNRNLVLECAQTDIPQEAKEHLAFMVAQLDKERAAFLEVFQCGMAELKTDLERSCDTISEQMVERERQLLQISVLQEQIDAIPIPPNNAKANPFHPANLTASIPSKLPPELERSNLPFSEGAALVKTVLNLSLANDLEPDSRALRTTGNIWENWKKPGE